MRALGRFSTRLYVTVIATSLLLGGAGCSGAKGLKITEANKDTVLAQIKDSKDFTVEEIGLLTSRQVRVSMATAMNLPKPDWVGLTIQQAIDDERTFQKDADAKKADADRLAAEAKAKEDALAEELRKTITLTAYEKGFRDSNPMGGEFEAVITLKYAYENRSEKDVRAFRGVVRFADLFDKEIITSGLTIEDPIKAGQKGTWSGGLKYNQFMQQHQELRNHDLKDMKVTWIPKSILFADGTQLGEK